MSENFFACRYALVNLEPRAFHETFTIFLTILINAGLGSKKDNPAARPACFDGLESSIASSSIVLKQVCLHVVYVLLAGMDMSHCRNTWHL